LRERVSAAVGNRVLKVAFASDDVGVVRDAGDLEWQVRLRGHSSVDANQTTLTGFIFNRTTRITLRGNQDGGFERPAGIGAGGSAGREKEN
jgi:hypothetical protein